MRTNKQTRRFVSWVLTLAMVLGLLAGTTVGVWAKMPTYDISYYARLINNSPDRALDAQGEIEYNTPTPLIAPSQLNGTYAENFNLNDILGWHIAYYDETVGSYYVIEDELIPTNASITFTASDHSGQLSPEYVTIDVQNKTVAIDMGKLTNLELVACWGDIFIHDQLSDDMSGQGWSYSKSNNALTLSGYSFNGQISGIHYVGEDDFNLVLNNQNSIVTNGGNFEVYSIFIESGNSVTVTGTGSLNVTAENNDWGITCDCPFIVSGGSLTVNAGGLGINTSSFVVTGGTANITGLDAVNANSVTVSGGELTAVGTGCNGLQVVGQNSFVLINGGTVDTSSQNPGNGDMGSGIYCLGTVTIEDGSLTAAAGTDLTTDAARECVAIYTSGEGNVVKNSIAGKGWTNHQGTGDGTDIAINKSGAVLTTYKKVVFGEGGSSDPVDATSIDIEEAVLELAPGDTQKLTLSVVPADAAVSWESNNESVASVSSDGTVTAVTDGTALITARSHNDLTATCPVTVKTPAHTHDLSYTADGATITASCSAVGCTLTQGKATLKVVPPVESVYDTKARTATLDISDESVFKNATIIYKKGDVELDAAPKDAGEYKATVTFGGVTAEASFAITPATPTISLADKTMDYNGSPAALEATVTLLGDDKNTAEISYSYFTDSSCNTPTDTAITPGEYYAKATVAEQDNYTAATSAAAKVTIKQAPVKISGITAESRMYKEGDKSATLVTDSAIIEGVVQGETVSFTVEGIFDDDAIGQDKKVTLTGYALIGPDSAKYALHPDCQKETTANIMGAEVASVTSASITTTGAVISAETTEAQTAAESAVNAIASNGVAAAETSSQKGLTEAAEDIAADSTVLDAARETASNSGITVSESNPLQVIPRLDAQVKEVTAEGSSVSSITLEMKGMYSVVAKNDPGTVLAEGEMQVNGVVPMEVSVPWADGFAWVRHDHQGNILNYKATVTSGVARFTSTQGCSEFVLSQETDSVAYIKNSGVEQYYNAFDKALDDIASSDDNTIYLVDNVTATVSKEVTFIVSKGGFTCTLTAGTNYEMTTSGTDPVTYTFTYHAPQTTGGGGGSSAKTETVQNADGSTTTTTTNADGSKVAVTKATNGTTVTVNTDKNGNVTSVAANVSAQAAQDAAKTGEAVALPGTIAKGQNVKVTVPAGSDVKVAIPVSGANAGTVLYAVDAAGNKTLIKDTAYENGKLVINVKQTATIVAGDNAKSFADVTSGRWSKNAVDFVTARELFNGTGATTFGPTETMTRGMLMTVLARYEGVDAYRSDWMEKGMAWSVSKGISDGSEPNRPITRQEIVTMMWRLAGSPVAGAQAASVLAAKPDGAKVADWAQAAMAWALENKVMNGNDKGYVNPESPATREEVAQFLMNYICR